MRMLNWAFCIFFMFFNHSSAFPTYVRTQNIYFEKLLASEPFVAYLYIVPWKRKIEKNFSKKEIPNSYAGFLFKCSKNWGIMLNANHTHFVFVDDGPVGKLGTEIAFRAKFEAFIETQGKIGKQSKVKKTADGRKKLSKFFQRPAFFGNRSHPSFIFLRRSLF